jgi:hypothetical protein
MSADQPAERCLRARRHDRGNVAAIVFACVLVCAASLSPAAALSVADRGPADADLQTSDIRMLLDAAGLSSFRILDRSEVSTDWPDASFVWTNRGAIAAPQDLVVGVLAEYPIGPFDTFDKVVRKVVLDWSKACSGAPRVRMDAPQKLGTGGLLRRALVECTGPESVLISRAFFVGGGETVLGFAHFFTDAGRAQGEAADDRMYEAFVRLVTK